MSHYLIVFDPAAEHRSLCIEKAKTELAELGLEVKTCESGNFAAAWACARAWPGESWSGPEGAAVLMGQALEGGQRRVRAGDLPGKWRCLPSAVPEPFDGIHMAAMCYGSRVFVAGDILGRFPVYYHTGSGHVVVASSPDLFRCHPEWRGEVDLEAIAGLLMLKYFPDGHSLWKGVRRLGAGNLLVCENGRTTEKVQYRLPLSDEHFTKSFEQHCDLVDSAFSEAIGRHMPRGVDYEMFCSGGLDTRMLAGYLRGQSLIKRAITWGERDDFEMQCARRVVKNIGVEHETWPVRNDEYPLFARRSVKWHSLALGFNAPCFWQDRHTPPAPGGFVSGQAMDESIGGGIVINSELVTGRPAGFEQLFARDNGWGIPLDVLKQLLRKEVFGDAPDAALSSMKHQYTLSGESDFHRVFAYTLLHRHRFHTASVIGLHGLWGWPVLPAFDRRMLQVLGGIPKESFFQRRIQKHLVCTRFPDLARLPIDANSTNPQPLLPHEIGRCEKWLMKMRRKISRLTGADRKERRFYYRVMDFNSAPWRMVRHEAEPGRKLLEAFFHKGALDRLVPPPDATLRVEEIVTNPSALNMDTIKRTSSAKTLTGLMLWARDRL